MPVFADGSKDYAKIPAGYHLIKLATKVGWSQKRHGSKKHEIIKYLQDNDVREGIKIIPYGNSIVPTPASEVEVPVRSDGAKG